MKKSDALATLLNISQTDLDKLDLNQLRYILSSLRYLSRIVEREIIKRESDRGIFG